MAMRMLQAGGMSILADGQRIQDEANPHGYFEFEPVKQLGVMGGDTSWLPRARGKAVKIVSSQLTWLPEAYDYRVLFMERDLDEVVASQEKLLALRDQCVRNGGDLATAALLRTHLEQVNRLLASRRCFETLRVPYREAIEQPFREAQRMARFVGASLDIEKMAAAVDRALYRNRASASLRNT
jgi:hypothetical protein